MTHLDKLRTLWQELYGNQDELLEDFLETLQQIKQTHFAEARETDPTWYKDAIVYSTYADLFHRDLKGLQEKLPYLQELGITCLWLLPVLESPMNDAGFDISNFEEVRTNLLGLPDRASPEAKEAAFAEFLSDVRQRGMRLIFDIAINHTSVEHPWFQEARQSPDSPKRAYYIWSETPDKFPKARVLMKGILEGNWTKDEVSGQYYLHRFYDFQPDLNYQNPAVLVEMTAMLIRWKIRGIDGIRADAVPFLWKEEGTTCESLPQNHTIVKFFRAALDYLEPGTLILAEACQPPREVVAYFGEGDECQGAYHFTVMPRIFRVLAEENATAVEMVMTPSFTPDIPLDCQWFIFLRCHDELTLEMVTPAEREFLYKFYTKDPRWNYRQGEGISARLVNLLDGDPRKIRLAYSIMFTLPGTPIIYYGDELAKPNDEAFYQDAIRRTGYVDSRNFVRGRIDWEQAECDLLHPNSLAYQVYHALQTMIRVRKQHHAFSWGTLEFVHFYDAQQRINTHILAYRRTWEHETRLVIQNLSAQEQQLDLDGDVKKPHDLLDQKLMVQNGRLTLPPYAVHWL
ncbi:alpha-amylase [candidate division KSB3 bacterium]|uniref:Alpha-amylase n=1 Tax=candidate division KSB3 bacterium TaxID=2044937 RepID=A0A9D5JWN9_9BACT|nr:alpha-amylase [candidate division KSB3 bacterium]MBD3325598.1 alpha-amylase [candidate division KSB3 bacterium]